MEPKPAGTGVILLTYLTTDSQVLAVLAWASAAITLLGFVVAIWQIIRVKRAADAARDAALGMARIVRSRELLAKLGDANNHLDAARNHVGSGSPEIAALCLELSRASIIEARQLSGRGGRRLGRAAGFDHPIARGGTAARHNDAALAR